MRQLAVLVFGVMMSNLLVVEGQCQDRQNKTTVVELVRKLESRHSAPVLSDDLEQRREKNFAGRNSEEQRRISGVLDEINKCWNEQCWETLVQECERDKYCLTIVNQHGFLENWTVGEVCEYLAVTQLTSRVDAILQFVEVPTTREHIGYQLDLLDGESLHDWRIARKEKSFIVLQSELVTKAKNDVEKDSNIRPLNRELVLRLLLSLERELKKVVRPQFVRVPLIGEKYSLPR